MKNQHVVSAGILIAVVLWMVIPQSAEEPDESNAPTASIVAIPEGVSPGESPSDYIVRAARVNQQTYGKKVRVRGRTQAFRHVEVRAEQAGRIVSEPVMRGARVSAGDLLCEIAIDDRDSNLLEAQSRQEQADFEYMASLDLQDKGLKILSAPGVSSPIMALTLSGIPTDKFLFIGFLPIKNSARRDYLLEIQYISASIIIFESAKRINKTLAELNEIFGNRRTSVCRELTKKFEEIISGNIESVIADLSNRESLKGEIVIVLEGFSDAYKKDIDIESMLLDALPIMSASEASKEVSKFTNLSRKEVYNIALKLKGKIKNDT